VITLEELREIMPHAKIGRLGLFLGPLNEAMQEFDISATVERETAFLAQIAHESGECRYVIEIASGEAYEGRKDLGNTEAGDGVRYKGRGLIQITGRANYAACSEALFGYPSKLLTNPELLEEPGNACRSAAWFWDSRGLNELADKGDFKLITKRINGGFNGYADRLAYFQRAQEALA
jgi:putative chitinase